MPNIAPPSTKPLIDALPPQQETPGVLGMKWFSMSFGMFENVQGALGLAANQGVHTCNPIQLLILNAELSTAVRCPKHNQFPNSVPVPPFRSKRHGLIMG